MQHGCLSGQGAIAAGPAPETPVMKQKYKTSPELHVCGDEVTLSPVLHRVVLHLNSRAGACSVWVIPGCEGTLCVLTLLSLPH